METYLSFLWVTTWNSELHKVEYNVKDLSVFKSNALTWSITNYRSHVRKFWSISYIAVNQITLHQKFSHFPAPYLFNLIYFN